MFKVLFFLFAVAVITLSIFGLVKGFLIIFMPESESEASQLNICEGCELGDGFWGAGVDAPDPDENVQVVN